VEYTVFLILGIATILFALNVVLRRNPAVCAVHLVGAFFCLSGIYLLIGFPFLAALQLMVYAGAIMVLLIFVIMLLDLSKEEERDVTYSSVIAPLFAGALLGLLATLLPSFEIATTQPDLGGESAARGGQQLAVALFSKHLLAFEATSLLLLAAILGVLVLAKKRGKSLRQQKLAMDRARRAEGGKV